jgi:hypothetical protein
VEPDSGIYDAMNQAVAKVQGEYILFLNCGDVFYDEKVLERAAERIEREQGEAPLVLYGDTYGVKNDVLIASPKKIDGFACYRNIPCHQSCFYATKLCREKPFNLTYRIRADYDHFLWCYYQAKAKMVYMDSVVSAYEGGGYSESRENRRRDKEEHREITEQYMSPAELAGYRRAMRMTLAPVRSFLAENRLTSGIYHWLKDCIYHHKIRIAIGVIFLIVELAFFFGSGVMREDVTNYLTGEGSWGEQLSEEAAGICQSFIPQYSHLRSLSFLMNMDQVNQQDGSVTILVADQNQEIIFEETRDFSDIADGYFTDVEVNLELSPRKTYYLSVLTEPSSLGEYPTVGVCSMSYYLPENQTLTHEDEMPDIQLMTRYEYENVMVSSKVRNIILLSLLTAFGIMFGLPDNKYLRRVAGIVILVVAPLVLGRRLELLNYNEVLYLPISMKWNVGMMYVLEFIVLLCTHSTSVSIVLTNVALTCLYTANYYVISFRGTPLRFNDFSALGTAVTVVGNYNFMPNEHLAMAWGLLLMLVVFGLNTGGGHGGAHNGRKCLKKDRIFWIKRLASYGVTIAIAIILTVYGGYQLLYTDLLNDVGFADKEYKGVLSELINGCDGYLVGTCVDIKNARVTAPEGYSVEAVERILENVAEESPEVSTEELPHIILVMNESFADLEVLGDLELSQDCLPFFYSLQDNTVRGYVNASVIGGGTANSEFEALTGCSISFLPANYYPYQQGIRGPVNSIVSQAEKYGYTTYSMHPQRKENWNRVNIYRYYGFDSSLWDEDFEGAEMVYHGVSDEETYNRIIELYENRKPNEKQFIFDVTMQNHGGYNAPLENCSVREMRLQNEQLDTYLSLIKISDEAFEKLVSYFEKQDEKVIICMFGDHQPSVSKKIVNADSSTPSEQVMNMYKTPFIIWANYDIEEADDYDISMNYLGGLLLRTAGVPLSPYFTYLEKLREEYPIITINGYVDNDGNYYNWGSAENEFQEYRMLQYNYLFDGNTVKWGY